MNERESNRREIKLFLRDLRDRIWSWDPVGLAEIGFPDDEYDCLVGPVTAGLRQGLGPEALAERLDAFIADHFGVDATNTAIFASDTVAWYRERKPPSVLG